MPLVLTLETIRQNPGDTMLTGAKPADGKHYWANSTPITGCQHPSVKNEEGQQVLVSDSMMVNGSGDTVK